MHVQIVNFNLDGLSESEFHAMTEEVAPLFAAIPGLITKLWLADPASNTYGGVYVWRDEAAMREYMASDLYKGIETNPHFATVTSRGFEALAGPTLITGGSIFQETVAPGSRIL